MALCNLIVLSSPTILFTYAFIWCLSIKHWDFMFLFYLSISLSLNKPSLVFFPYIYPILFSFTKPTLKRHLLISIQPFSYLLCHFSQWKVKLTHFKEFKCMSVSVFGGNKGDSAEAMAVATAKWLCSCYSWFPSGVSGNLSWKEGALRLPCQSILSSSCILCSDRR